MLDTIFATKTGMSQVWTQTGKRMPVTKFKVEDNVIIGQQKGLSVDRQKPQKGPQPCLIFEIGYGQKKLKNMPKPLREKIKKSGFSTGLKQIKGVKIFESDLEENQEFKPGQILELSEILTIGDVVKVTGTSKGKGFAGGMKRHNFSGGPRTHGQRDRERAIGSIGAMTDPGRVFKGKKMPGHMGVEQNTVKNLVIAHIDSAKNEVWVTGPTPGHRGSVAKISRSGQERDLKLDKKASGIAKVANEAEQKAK
jgi:large subunit ribosomal protein L3